MDKPSIDLTNLNHEVNKNLFDMMAVAFFTGKAVVIPTETINGEPVDVLCMWDDTTKGAFPLAIMAHDPHSLKPPTGATAEGVKKVRVGIETGSMVVLGDGVEGAKHGETFNPEVN